jgi:hypothetical protein
MTVKVKSVVPSAPMFCTIMSTSMFASDRGPGCGRRRPADRDAEHGELGLVTVEGDAGNERLFHAFFLKVMSVPGPS